MKKVLAIFLVILSLSFGLVLTACDRDGGKSLDEVTFVDASFDYDGKEHKVEVANLPEGYSVEYIPKNVQKDAGEYRIIARIKDADGNVVKEMAAMLIIVAPVVEEPEHECDFTGEWVSDATHHWHECECGLTDTKVAHSGGEATTEAKAECEVCGAEYGELKTPEDPATEEPTQDDPVTEDPVTEEPVTEEPTQDDPATEEPVTEEPVTEEPTQDDPVTEDPATEESGNDEPTQDDPVTEDEIEVGYVVEVGGVTYKLTENEEFIPKPGDTAIAEYMALGLAVSEGDKLSLRLDGETIDNIGPAIGDTNVDADLYVLETATSVGIYVKQYPDGGYSVWLEGKTSGSTGGDQGGSSDIPSGSTITIYFSSPNNSYWGETTYVYFWADGGEGAWPGYEMTFVETNEFGQKVFSAQVDLSQYQNVIFHNNNGWQTVDIKLTGVVNNTGWYIINNDGNVVDSYIYGA